MCVRISRIATKPNGRQAVSNLTVFDKSGDAQLSLYHDVSKTLPLKIGDVIEVDLRNASIHPRNSKYTNTDSDYAVTFKQTHLTAVQVKDGDCSWLPTHSYKCAAAASLRGEWNTLLRGGPPLVLQICAHQGLAGHETRHSSTPAVARAMGQRGDDVRDAKKICQCEADTCVLARCL